ncbi:Dihydrolipoamide acetyltransferase component (E2) of acetoin dehydrogenase complex [Leifsonia rubra CMS 76R]|nr:Dihydrolipoamide acetyltransferase component (E2) of acetoin dehydrogenase complex [Leifsonia rubra CMS 76R]
MAELPLTMPKMSMTMEEGTMVAWLKQVGDPVRSGEPICEVATDKVDMEVESPFDGVLARIIAEPDDVYPVGDVIAYITTDADDLLGGLFDEPADEAPAAAPANDDVAPVAAAPAPIETGWVSAVPAARGVAEQHNIDLATVTPTGPDNTVRVADVEAAAAAAEGQGSAAATPAAAAPAAATPAKTEDPVEARRLRTRKQVAKVMSASALVPQFTAYVDLDLSALAAVRKTTLGGASWTALFVRAQAIALAENAALNGTWTDEGVAANDHIGIALAIDSPSGLIAPVLMNSHEGTLAELVAEIATVVGETRSGTLPPARLGGGTSVFSNLGGFGVESFNALLTPPQSTALSSGAVKPRMRVFDDETFGVRLSCTIGLTVDHRVADGADAARMLAIITNLVATPERLL